MFEKIIGLAAMPTGDNVIFRKAVRAVITTGERKLIMVKSANGDYRFPGGGLEADEDLLTTLKREALEEAGAIVAEAVRKIGTVEERRKSYEVADTYFVMKSTYYLCQAAQMVEPQLEDYEKELGFEPAVIKIAEALETNKKILEQQPDKINPCVRRDTVVLEYLLDNEGMLD